MNAPAFRRLTPAVTVLCATFFLSSCTLIDVFGPRPDAALTQLARQADADAAQAEGDLATLRTEHASELYDEIARLCGRDDQGAVPESCEIPSSPKESVAASPAPLGKYLEALGDVPDESHDLVVDQSIDLAVLDSSELMPLTITEADRGVVVDMIEREYATTYALKAARAYASDPAAVDALVESHQKRLLKLSSAIADPPVPAAGYELGDISTGDDFIRTEEENLIAAWRAAAAAAEDPDSQMSLISAAADVTTAYQEF